MWHSVTLFLQYVGSTLESSFHDFFTLTCILITVCDISGQPARYYGSHALFTLHP